MKKNFIKIVDFSDKKIVDITKWLLSTTDEFDEIIISTNISTKIIKKFIQLCKEKKVTVVANCKVKKNEDITKLLDLGFGKVLLLQSFLMEESLVKNLMEKNKNKIYQDTFMANIHDISKRLYYMREPSALVKIMDNFTDKVEFPTFELIHKDLQINAIGTHLVISNYSKFDYIFHSKWPVLEISDGMYTTNIGSKLLVSKKHFDEVILVPPTSFI